MDKKEWQEKLSKQNDPKTATWILEHDRESEKAKFLKDIGEKKLILTAYGAFGPENDEDEPTDAYIDKVINPEEGGTFIKYYGCPILYAGMSSLPVVRALRIPKYIFAGLPKDIFRFSKFLSFSVVLAWFFSRKGLLNIIKEILNQIDYKVLKIIETWPEKSYNESEQEIYRALIESGRKEKIWDEIVYFGARFLRMFLFIDNTYKSRIQDALYEANNLIQVLNILISREVKSSGSTQTTWKIIRFAAKIALWTSPALKRIEKKFFKELNKEKVKMTESDEFYSNLYKSYNFRGLTREERKEQWKQQVKEHKVIFLLYSAGNKNKF